MSKDCFLNKGSPSYGITRVSDLWVLQWCWEDRVLLKICFIFIGFMRFFCNVDSLVASDCWILGTLPVFIASLLYSCLPVNFRVLLKRWSWRLVHEDHNTFISFMSLLFTVVSLVISKGTAVSEDFLCPHCPSTCISEMFWWYNTYWFIYLLREYLTM